ncbi:21019_t:CDS:2 [Cetraspora pellucida]|uniref:21019_t:CDS:1 n=1 Tax=Cetraspora pellucida TaxID=1433469 RepID=A0A9N9ESG1_9GLOM|nr:21019_t:CDS:2 [Cetraspora pellucida]
MERYANDDILTALGKLNNTFFVEDSSSKSELIISDNKIKSESDNDKSFNSFNKIYLNSYEYINNPDNYIEDKAYDDLKLKVKEFFKNRKCTCYPKCFEKIGYEHFLAHQIEFENLSKNIRDLVVKGQLMAFQKDENTKKVTTTNRKYLQFNYCFNNSLSVCYTTYEVLVRVNHKYIDAIIQYLKEYSLDERIYSNTVYHDYIQAFKAEYPNKTHIIAESTFTKLDIQYANEQEKKIEIIENYLADLNLAKEEHDYYNANIKLVINDGTCNLNQTNIEFKFFNDYTHIAYYWTQNILVPYSLQQIGSLFFKSSHKIYLFGVCNIGNYPHTEQTNYVIDEGKMPNNGKQGKSMNCILSLV